MDQLRDEFLSEEDLDLRNLSEDELIAYWNLWLKQAQATNDLDEKDYSHGVFETAPGHGEYQPPLETSRRPQSQERTKLRRRSGDRRSL